MVRHCVVPMMANTNHADDVGSVSNKRLRQQLLVGMTLLVKSIGAICSISIILCSNVERLYFHFGHDHTVTKLGRNKNETDTNVG